MRMRWCASAARRLPKHGVVPTKHSAGVCAQTLSNDDNDKFTMLRVEVPDRPGLLTDLVQTLRCARSRRSLRALRPSTALTLARLACFSVANVSVVAASIRTHGSTAVDVFKITDSSTGGKLSSEKFEALRRGVAHRARRQAISQSLGHAPSSVLTSASPVTPPPPTDLVVIDMACSALPPFMSLITSERNEIYAEMHQLRFPPGEVLVTEGTEVQQFVVVLSGEVEGTHRRLRAGDVLGELGIVQTALSPDTWRAGPAGASVYAVDRRTLHSLLHGAAGRRRQRAASALQALPVLESLTKGQLFALVDVMRRAEHSAGTQLTGAFLHIVLRGTVCLSDRGALHRCNNADDTVPESSGPLTGDVLARAGDAYGEAACLANSANPLGVTASAASEVELMTCDRDTFTRVLGQPEALLLPGTQRKMSVPRPPPFFSGAVEVALASGVSAVDLAGESIAEDAEEEAAAQMEDVVSLARAPAEDGSAGLAAGAATDARTSVGGSGNRFRTPNQDVTWHGSSALREVRKRAAQPSLVCNSLLTYACAPQALGGLVPVPVSAKPKSALTSSLSLAADAAEGTATEARRLPERADDRSAPRATSAPSELSNISCSSPAPGSSGQKGQWGMSLALGDFLLGAKLGEGLTGRVHYAKLKVRGSECALKVMRKAKLVELGEEHHVRSELDALGRIASPFVTALLGCFQDVRAVYLAIEYMRGPDLFAYMCVALWLLRLGRARTDVRAVKLLQA